MEDGSERRRSLRLHRPVHQLRPVLAIMAATLGFLMLLGLLASSGFGPPLKSLFADQPPSLAALIAHAAEDFGVVVAIACLGYVLCVAGICVAYSQRIFGPIVAFQRHVESLKNGDYGARVALRDGDAFAQLERDLNELAEILEAKDTDTV